MPIVIGFTLPRIPNHESIGQVVFVSIVKQSFSLELMCLP